VADEKLYWLGFNFLQVRPEIFTSLRKYFGSAAAAWKSGECDKLIPGLSRAKNDLDLRSYYFRLREKSIDCYFAGDNLYPDNLFNIDTPPYVIFVKGRLIAEDRRAVALVGSRRMTVYGRTVCRGLTRDLVRSKFTIVSGLARGIDSVAHRTALESGGRTIAVLGGGLDRIYPPENRLLAQEIVKQGALVSEYPPGMEAKKENFPNRNRIIAGLSLGVVVVEGTEKSGALITATCAAEQGRDVFAVPGPISSPTAAGPSRLIQNGAKLVYEIDDILDEL